jgi:hypothetical protein
MADNNETHGAQPPSGSAAKLGRLVVSELNHGEERCGR